MAKELEKNYNPAQIEQKWYDNWVENKFMQK